MIRMDSVSSSRGRQGQRRIACWVLVSMMAVGASSASALTIDFNFGALVINDNFVGDNNLTLGIIDFNTTVGNYALQGTVDLVAGPNQVALLGSPNANLRLTNFTAEALVNAAGSFDLEFYHVFPGLYTGVVGADSLDAYVGHASGAPVPFGMDQITQWQGYVSGQIVSFVLPGPPPYFNPFLPASSPPLPYSVVTHGPSAVPPGTFTNPVIGAYLGFDLGAVGDQLILYTSAEVGISSVPEASSFVMMGVAAMGAGLVGLRRRRQAR